MLLRLDVEDNDANAIMISKKNANMELLPMAGGTKELVFPKSWKVLEN